MSRRHIAIVALVVVATAVLSALVAYRRALGHRTDAAGVADAAGPEASGADDAQCLGIDKAAGHVGENRCVSGLVLRVYASRGGNTFLDFCQDYRRCPFTSVIFAADRQKFGNLETLAGREIEIRGKIELYQGRAEIVIHDAEQIQAP